jgi:hypothetical protein
MYLKKYLRNRFQCLKVSAKFHGDGTGSKYTDQHKKRLIMISLINDFEIIFFQYRLFFSSLNLVRKIGVCITSEENGESKLTSEEIFFSTTSLRRQTAVPPGGGGLR